MPQKLEDGLRRIIPVAGKAIVGLTTLIDEAVRSGEEDRAVQLDQILQQVEKILDLAETPSR